MARMQTPSFFHLSIRLKHQKLPISVAVKRLRTNLSAMVRTTNNLKAQSYEKKYRMQATGKVNERF
jgi:hypothetical protein